MELDIHIARTEEELNELYQLRYKIYIEELGRTQKHADHALRTIKEPIDEFSENFVAYHHGQLIGAVRFHFCNRYEDSVYQDVYKFKRFGHFYPNHISYVTKLIVLPEFRNRIIALRLAEACYRLGMKMTYFNIIDCYQPLIPFFIRLGYRFYTEDTYHPEFGKVTPMVLLSRDFIHLEKVKSPFAHVPERNWYKEEAESNHFFNENFADRHQEIYQGFKNKIMKLNKV